MKGLECSSEDDKRFSAMYDCIAAFYKREKDRELYLSGICPRCRSAEINAEDFYCKICGLKVPVNLRTERMSIEAAKFAESLFDKKN